MSGNMIVYDKDDKRIVFPILNDDLWQSQDNIAHLFGVTRAAITQHINNIYREEELDKDTTRKKMPRKATDGKSYRVWFYNLDMIIAIGYRVSSKKGTDFRKWATPVLRDYIEKGHVIDHNRMLAQPNSFEELALEVQDIRTSEMGMYRKLVSVFAMTSADFDPDSHEARQFFATCQNLFHYAVTKQTAAEIVQTRCDHKLPNVGMTSLPDIIPDQLNVTVAKNYLSEYELRLLKNICEQFLVFAESRAMHRKEMTMDKWVAKLRELISINDFPLLEGNGRVSRSDANNYAKAELRLYNIRMLS